MAIVLGKSSKFFGDKVIEHKGAENVVALGSRCTGIAKGIVIPTLFKWERSAVVVDIGGEITSITASTREAMKQEVMIFNPTGDPENIDRRAVHYNPLAEIRMETRFEYGDVCEVVDLLLEIPDGRERTLAVNESRTLLIATILHLLYAYKKEQKGVPTLQEVMNFILKDDGKSTIWDSIEEINEGFLSPWESLAVHPNIPTLVAELKHCITGDDSVAAVLTVVCDALKRYCEPWIAANLKSDESLIEKIIRRNPTKTVYLVMSLGDVSCVMPIIRMFLSQLVKRQTEVQRTEKDLLLVLNDFEELGRLDWLENEMGIYYGLGIQILITSTSIPAIQRNYSPRNSILENCHVKIFKGVADMETAKYVSGLSGGKLREFDVTCLKKEDEILFKLYEPMRIIRGINYWEYISGK